MWRGKNNMLAIVLLCISSGILTARCILLVLFSILTLGPPPCIFNARTVATRTTTFGCRPETRHLMLKNFSIPMSAPNPASVTVRKHEWHEAEKPTQTSHKSKIIYLKCKYFIQMLSYFFAAPDPAGAALVERRKTMQRGAQKKRGQQFTELPSVQENWNEKWVHRAWAKPKGLWYGGPYTQASWTRSKLSKLSTWNDSLCWDKLSCCCACVSGPYCVWHHSSEALAVTPTKHLRGSSNLISQTPFCGVKTTWFICIGGQKAVELHMKTHAHTLAYTCGRTLRVIKWNVNSIADIWMDYLKIKK